MVFLDASALAKAYLDEEGTRNVEGVLGRSPGEVFISDLVALEVLTTIRIALRTAAYAEYKAALDSFRADYSARFSILEVDAGGRTSAMGLTTRHREARARSMDVLHLATALRLQSATRARTVTLVTSDRDLADLATRCGLRTFDPSRELLAALPRVPRR
jgi:predicted nucleic acid-binding protein